jgi:membrane protein
MARAIEVGDQKDFNPSSRLRLIFEHFYKCTPSNCTKVMSKYTYFMTTLTTTQDQPAPMPFPWRHMLDVLMARFKHERLAQTAGSLTFTTTMALVPCLTVVLAVFTAFPLFNQFQTVLQNWLIQSLIPESIARQVLGYLTQFSSKASRLVFLDFWFCLSLLFQWSTPVDRTLNAIWRVKNAEP